MRTAIAAAVTAAGLVFAAPAAATPAQDAAYLRMLHDYGLSTRSPSTAITVGHTVCRILDDGKGIDAAVFAVDTVVDVNHAGAIVVVSAAILYYCPWHTPAPQTFT